jgi:hypothetical protein
MSVENNFHKGRLFIAEFTSGFLCVLDHIFHHLQVSITKSNLPKDLNVYLSTQLSFQLSHHPVKDR